MKNWEVCPLCEGSGIKKRPYINIVPPKPSKTPEEVMKAFIENGQMLWDKEEDNHYDVCNGKRIISSITGLPPKSEKYAG